MFNQGGRKKMKKHWKSAVSLLLVVAMLFSIASLKGMEGVLAETDGKQYVHVDESEDGSIHLENKRYTPGEEVIYSITLADGKELREMEVVTEYNSVVARLITENAQIEEGSVVEELKVEITTEGDILYSFIMPEEAVKIVPTYQDVEEITEEIIEESEEIRPEEEEVSIEALLQPRAATGEHIQKVPSETVRHTDSYIEKPDRNGGVSYIINGTGWNNSSPSWGTPPSAGGWIEYDYHFNCPDSATGTVTIRWERIGTMRLSDGSQVKVSAEAVLSNPRTGNKKGASFWYSNDFWRGFWFDSEKGTMQGADANHSIDMEFKFYINDNGTKTQIPMSDNHYFMLTSLDGPNTKDVAMNGRHEWIQYLVNGGVLQTSISENSLLQNRGHGYWYSQAVDENKADEYYGFYDMDLSVGFKALEDTVKVRFGADGYAFNHFCFFPDIQFGTTILDERSKKGVLPDGTEVDSFGVVQEGDILTYRVSQRIITGGVNGLTQYKSFIIEDILPEQLDYIEGSAYVMRNDMIMTEEDMVQITKEVKDGKTYIRAVFSEAWLKSVWSYQGQLYSLYLQATPNEKMYDVTKFYNEGNVYVNGQEFDAGEVEAKPPSAVLVLDKTADKYEYQVGDRVNYTVIVRALAEQEDDSGAVQVLIEDITLPEGLKVDTYSVSGGVNTNITESGTGWKVTADRLLKGESIKIEYSCIATEAVNGKEIVNTANVTCKNLKEDDDRQKLEDVEEVYINTARLTLDKKVAKREDLDIFHDTEKKEYTNVDGNKVDHTEWRVGESVKYQVSVTSSGEEGTIARNIVISDTSLPEGLKLNDGEDAIRVTLVPIDFENPIKNDKTIHNETETKKTIWNLSRKGTGWELVISDLPQNEKVVVTFLCEATEAVNGMEVVNIAKVTAQNIDETDNRNTLKDSSKVWINSPRLSITKEADKMSVQVGDDIKYKIVVKNTQVGTVARRVIIEDAIKTEGATITAGDCSIYDSEGKLLAHKVVGGSDHPDTNKEDVLFSYNRNDQSFVFYTNRYLVGYDRDDTSKTKEDFYYFVYDREGNAEPDYLEKQDKLNPLAITKEDQFTIETTAHVGDKALEYDTVDNTAKVWCEEESDPDETEETVPINKPELAIVKTSDKYVYQLEAPNNIARYEIEVTQLTQDMLAKNVVIKDRLDYDGLFYNTDAAHALKVELNGEDITSSVDLKWDDDGKGFVIHTGKDLGRRDKIRVTYYVTFTGANLENTKVTNLSKAEADNAEDVETNQTVTISPSEPILSVRKNSDKSVYQVGDTGTYALIIKQMNLESGAAKDVIITDRFDHSGVEILEDSFKLVEIDDETRQEETITIPSENITITEQGFEIRTQRDLEYGKTWRVIYRVVFKEKTLVGQSVRNVAVAEGSNTDKESDDNIVEIEKPIVIGYTVTLHKDSDPVSGSQVREGEVITYYLHLKNTGIDAAPYTHVRDRIPEGTTYVDGSADEEGVYQSEGNYVEWVVADLEPNETRTLTFKVKVNEGIDTDKYILNYALYDTMNSSPGTPGEITSEPQKESNHVNHWLTEPTNPEIEVEKMSEPVSGSIVKKGDRIIYSLAIRSMGGQDAKNVVVRDYIPENTEYVEDSVSDTETFGGMYHQSKKYVQWVIPVLKVGETKTVSFEVRVSDSVEDGDIIENQALYEMDWERGNTGDPENSTNIIEHLVKNRKITVKKVWNHGENTQDKWPQGVKVQLNKMKEDGTYELVEEVLLNETNNWKYTWEELDSTAQYRITEDVIEGYMQTINNNGSAEIVITNKYVEDEAYKHVKVVKIWVGDTSEDRPERIQVQLYRIKQGTNQRELVEVVELHAGNNWSYDWGNKMDAAYNYEVVELGAPFPGYDPPHYTGNDSPEQEGDVGLIITNPKKATSPDTKSITVTKTWSMQTETEHTDAIQVQLYKNGQPEGVPVTLNAQNHWTHTWSGLLSDAVYTVKEIGLQGGWNCEVSGDEEQGFQLNNYPALSIIKRVTLGMESGADDNHKETEAGEFLTYTLFYKNESERTKKVNVTDWTPRYTTYVSAQTPPTVSPEVGAYGKIEWKNIEVAPGETLKIIFTVKIDKDTPSGIVIENTGIIQPENEQEYETNTTYNPVKDKDIIPGDRVTVYKSADPTANETVKAGDKITYKLTAKNTGGSTSGYTRIRDYIPEGTTYVEGSASDGGIYVREGNYVEWIISGLKPTQTKEVSFAVTVDKQEENKRIKNVGLYETTPENPGKPGEIPEDPEDPTNPVEHPKEEEDQTNAVLQLIKDSNPEPGTIVKAGDTIVYKLTLRNIGGSTSKNVVVRDYIPNGTTYVRDSMSNGGTYHPEKNYVQWVFDELKPGEEKTLIFKVIVNPGTTFGEIVNQALYGDDYSPEDENDPGNSSNIVEHPKQPDENVIPGEEVTVYKSANPVGNTAVKAGDKITYYLTARNTGESTSGYTRIRDYIPEGTTYVEGSASDGGIYVKEGNYVEWIISGIEPAQTKQVSFAVTVDEQKVGTVIKNVGIYETTPTDPGKPGEIPEDPDKPTNPVEHTPDEEAPSKAVIQVIKDSIPAAGTMVKEGDIITYKLTVKNSGGSEGKNIALRDEIPKGTVYVEDSVSDNGTYHAQEGYVQWLIASLKPGEEKTVTFKVRVGKISKLSTIKNQALYQPDYDKNKPDEFENDSNIVEHPAAPSGSVSIKKEAVEKVVKPGDTAYFKIVVYNGSDVDTGELLIKDSMQNEDGKRIKGNFVEEKAENPTEAEIKYEDQNVRISNLKPGEKITLWYAYKTPNNSTGKLHNVATLYDKDGNEIGKDDAEITIQKTPSGGSGGNNGNGTNSGNGWSNKPKTGDSTQMLMMMAVLCFCAAGVITIVAKWKKEEK